MKERPILFSAPMVRAILAGTKTQTRRTSGLEDVNARSDAWRLHRIGELDYATRAPFKGRFGAYLHSEEIEPGTLSVCPVACPYGKPGDRLWVRETWSVMNRERTTTVRYVPRDLAGSDFEVVYRADEDHAHNWWKPSIHMPRWASRITLEITDVRVQRLNDISEEDARAEGVEPYVFGHGQLTEDELRTEPGYWSPNIHRNGFSVLWDSIHGEGAWQRNEWVWAISFRRLP